MTNLLCNPEFHLLCLQWPINGPYPQSHKSCLCSHALFLEPLRTSLNVNHSLILAESILVIHKLAAAGLLSSALHGTQKNIICYVTVWWEGPYSANSHHQFIPHHSLDFVYYSSKHAIIQNRRSHFVILISFSFYSLHSESAAVESGEINNRWLL